jgi:phage-related tail protein
MALKMASSVGAAGSLKAAIGEGLLSAVGGPWGLAIGAATVLVVGIGSAMEKTRRQTEDWAHALADGGAAARQAMAEMEKAPGFFDRVTLALSGHNAGMGAAASRTNEAKQALEEYRRGLDPVAEAQSRVTEWTNTLSDRLVNGKVTTEDARTAQERLAYWSDVLAQRQGALKDAVAGATSTTQTFEQQTKDARDALDATKQATDDFKLSLDILSPAPTSMRSSLSRASRRPG